MKIIFKPELPNCDFCGNDATYDAPTYTGQWANMCETCFKVHKGMSAEAVGTKFKQRDIAKPKDDGKIHQGLEANEPSLDDREIKCPECGDLRSVEPDAEYTYTCESCGIVIKVPEGIY